jgi:hypothetical protein
MAADANVYQQFLQPVRSMADYGNELDRRDMNALQLVAARRQNELAGFTLDQQKNQAQQAIARQNALQALASDPRMSDPLAREAAMLNHPLLSAEGQALRNSRLEAVKLENEGNRVGQEAADKALGRYRGLLDRARNPQEAAQVIQAQFQDPVLRAYLPQVPIEQALQGIPTDPQQFAMWQRQESMGMTKAQEAMAPKPVEFTLGDKVVFYDMNPQSPTFRQQVQSAAIGQSPDNKATVGASYANAAALREQATATRDAARIQRDQATEMKLADDYRQQSKDFKESMSAHKQLESTLGSATTSPAATLAAATKFMKILDPGSVVRESELGMALAASGVIDRAMNYVNILQRGQVLTKTQAADFKKISGDMFNAAKQVQQSIDKDYQGKAKAYGLRPEMVTQDLGQNAKEVNFSDLK